MKIVECALCVILVFTFPLQCVPLFSCLDFSLPTVHWTARRLLLCLAICIAGIICPDPTKVISFSGALAFGYVGFIMPAACHFRLFSDDRSAGQTCINGSLFVVGVVAMALGVKGVLD